MLGSVDSQDDRPSSANDRRGPRRKRGKAGGHGSRGGGEKKARIDYSPPSLAVDEPDKLGVELFEASEYEKTVKTLIENGANLNIADVRGRDPPLILAVSNNCMSSVRLLVKALCDISIRGHERKTAAELAKEMGRHAIADYLTYEAPRVQAEIRLDPTRKEAARRDFLGEELVRACGLGTTAEAKKLIRAGAPVDWQDQFGNAALHLASIMGRTKLLTRLIEKKANLDTINEKGNTPLAEAVVWREMSCIRALVEAGADVAIPNKNDKTAAVLARHEGQHAIEKFLTRSLLIRFDPSDRDESGQLARAKGRATRAMERDLLATGMLPVGPVSIIKEFATGRVAAVGSLYGPMRSW